MFPFKSSRFTNGRWQGRNSAPVVAAASVNSANHNGGLKLAINAPARPRRTRRRRAFIGPRNRPAPKAGPRNRPRRSRRQRAVKPDPVKSAALNKLVVDEVELETARKQYAASIHDPFSIDPPCGGGFDGPSECITGTSTGLQAASANTYHLYQCGAAFKASYTMYKSALGTTALSASTITAIDSYQQTSFTTTAASGFREFRPLVAGLIVSIEDSANAVYPTVVVGLVPQDGSFTSQTFNQLVSQPYARIIPNARTATVVWVPTDTISTIFTSQPLTTGTSAGFSVPYILLLNVSATCIVSVSYVVHGDAVRGTVSGDNYTQIGGNPVPSANYSLTDLMRGFAPLAEASVSGVYNFFRDNPGVASTAMSLFAGRMGPRRLMQALEHVEPQLYPLSDDRGYTNLTPVEIKAHIDDRSFKDMFDSEVYYKMIQLFGQESKSIEARLYHIELELAKSSLDDEDDEKFHSLTPPGISQSTVNLAEDFLSRIQKGIKNVPHA